MPNFIPESSSLTAQTAAASESVAHFVGDAARGVADSIAHDGATVVSQDASLGARVEAGANLAADAAGFFAGPEEVGLERAGVFAIKEGIEHAPQLRAVGEALGKEALAAAPEAAETVGAAFSRTKALLTEAGHEITDSRPAKGIIETKNAIYSIIEQGGEANFSRLGDTFYDAKKKGINFAVHAPDLGDAAIREIEAKGYSDIAKGQGFVATLATSEVSIAKSIGEMERGNGIVAKLQDHRLSVKDAFDVAKTVSAANGIYEAAKHFVEAEQKTPAGQALEKRVEHLAANIRHDAVTAVHEGEHTIEAGSKHMRSGLEHAESTGLKALHAVEGVAHEAGQHLTSAAQHAAAEIAKWSPDMAFDQFEKVLNHVRGGVAPQAHEPAVSRAPAHGHGIGH